jgi:nicotinamidase-related amidase
MDEDQPPRYEPSRSAVVVVDVQNDFCDPDGVLARCGNDHTAVVAMVPQLQRFLAAARERGVRTVYVRTTHDETTSSPGWKACKPVRAVAGSPLGPACRPGSWGAEFYRVAPADGDPVVTKHRYSAFTGTNLDLVLRSAGVTSLFVTGVATEVCVESTLRDGLFHDYHVTLVSDCCASYDPAAHEATVTTVGRYFGVVAGADEVLTRLAPR